jgi:hypothetical protein
MTETLAALLFAHVLADFLFQTRWMVENKRRPAALAAHGAVVLATAIAATGTVVLPLFWLATLHVAVDAGKARLAPGLGAFLGDQALHLAAIAALAAWQPGLWAGGLWSQYSALPALMAVAAGAILATRAGGFAIGFLMARWADALPQNEVRRGLLNGGEMIGLLERGMIFLLVLTGQPEGIGFLIAAKSVLRFGTVGDDRAISEYVIIGTLASFGWAIAASFLTLALLGALPPLGIPDLSP